MGSGGIEGAGLYQPVHPGLQSDPAFLEPQTEPFLPAFTRPACLFFRLCRGFGRPLGQRREFLAF